MRNSKKILSLALALGLAANLVSGPFLNKTQADGLTFSISSSRLSYTEGQVGVMSMTADVGAGVASGAEFHITYESSKVTVNSVVLNPVFDNFLDLSEAGEIILMGISQGDSAKTITGQAPLGRFTFSAVAGGSALFHVTQADFILGNDIVVTSGTGTDVTLAIKSLAQQQEEDRLAEEQKKQEELKKQQEEQRKKEEALKKQQEELRKQEELKKQEEARKQAKEKTPEAPQPELTQPTEESTGSQRHSSQGQAEEEVGSDERQEAVAPSEEITTHPAAEKSSSSSSEEATAARQAEKQKRADDLQNSLQQYIQKTAGKTISVDFKSITTATDSDKDGISDEMEIKLGTNPFSSGETVQGISDSTRVLLGVDTQEIAKAPEQRIAKITDLANGDILTDLYPNISGMVSAGARKVVIEATESGAANDASLVLGTVTAFSRYSASDAVNSQVKYFHLEGGSYSQALTDHKTYSIKAIATLGNGAIVESAPVSIEIDSGVSIGMPSKVSLDNELAPAKSMTGAIEMLVSEKQPLLAGKTDFNSQVVAVWESVVLASSVISDSAEGSFAFKAPKELPTDESHRVTLYAVKDANGKNIRSKSVTIHFRIPKGLALTPFVYEGGLSALLVVFAGALWFVYRRKRVQKSTVTAQSSAESADGAETSADAPQTPPYPIPPKDTPRTPPDSEPEL